MPDVLRELGGARAASSTGWRSAGASVWPGVMLSDVTQLGTELRVEMALLGSELRAEMAERISRSTPWTLGVLAPFIGLSGD